MPRNVCEDSSAPTELGEATATPPASLDTASPGDEVGITAAVRFGRVAKSIESGLYDENITPPRLRGFVTSSNVTDTIRAGSGKFYTSDTTTGEMILFNKKHSPTDLPFTVTPHDEVRVAEDAISYYVFTQNITVTYSKRRGRFVQYSNAIRNALESQYLDSYSRVDYPVGKSFINDLGVTSNPSYVDITAFYNFFQESVEAKYQDESTIEQEQIPNFYSFFLNEEPEVPSDLLLFEPSPVAPTLEEASITPTPSDSPAIISDPGFGTGEASPFTLEDARLTEVEGRDPLERARESRGRPETVIEVLEAGIRRGNELVRSRYNRVFLMSYDVGNLTEISKNKALFPMYVDIEFSMDPTTEFAEYVKATKMAKIFQRDLSYGYEGNVGYVSPRNVSYFESRENIFQRRVGEAPEKRIENSTVNKRIISFNDLLSNINNPKDSPLKDESTYFYDEDENLSLLQPSPTPTFDRRLMTEVLKQKIKTLVRTKMRTYRQMTEGTPCYSETILYRVEKLREDGQLVQNFHFLNSNDINLQKFIDTQVKYEQGYRYNVYGYEVIIGSKYSYSGTVPVRATAGMIGGARAILTTTCKPNLIISENLLFSRDVKIVDSPSTAPDVEFVQFKGKNMIRLLLNGNYDSYIKPPVIIEPGEASEINDIIANQQLTNATPHVFYRTDDHPVSFEVYRTTTKPKEYKDFAGSLLASVSTDVFKDSPQKATSASYDDLLTPNTKYYYMIRSRDVHGKLSYPSYVHQIEVVKNSGIVYMTHEIVELGVKQKKNKSKGINKFIKISPASEQLDISPEMLSLTYDEMSRLRLGTADETLWSRKFKMRITSKSTGRRAEIDFRFTHKHETDDS
jgi:hypothetical protein